MKFLSKKIHSLSEAMSKGTEDGMCRAQFGFYESNELISRNLNCPNLGSSVLQMFPSL